MYTKMDRIFHFWIILFYIQLNAKVVVSNRTCNNFELNENITCCVPTCSNLTQNESCDYSCPFGMSLLSTEEYSGDCEPPIEVNKLTNYTYICVSKCPYNLINIIIAETSVCIECKVLCSSRLGREVTSGLCSCENEETSRSYYTTEGPSESTYSKAEIFTENSSENQLVFNIYILSGSGGVVILVTTAALICICRWKNKIAKFEKQSDEPKGIEIMISPDISPEDEERYMDIDTSKTETEGIEIMLSPEADEERYVDIDTKKKETEDIKTALKMNKAEKKKNNRNKKTDTNSTKQRGRGNCDYVYLKAPSSKTSDDQYMNTPVNDNNKDMVIRTHPNTIIRRDVGMKSEEDHNIYHRSSNINAIKYESMHFNPNNQTSETKKLVPTQNEQEIKNNFNVNIQPANSNKYESCCMATNNQTFRRNKEFIDSNTLRQPSDNNKYESFCMATNNQTCRANQEFSDSNALRQPSDSNKYESFCLTTNNQTLQTNKEFNDSNALAQPPDSSKYESACMETNNQTVKTNQQPQHIQNIYESMDADLSGRNNLPDSIITTTIVDKHEEIRSLKDTPIRKTTSLHDSNQMSCDNNVSIIVHTDSNNINAVEKKCEEDAYSTNLDYLQKKSRVPNQNQIVYEDMGKVEGKCVLITESQGMSGECDQNQLVYENTNTVKQATDVERDCNSKRLESQNIHDTRVSYKNDIDSNQETQTMIKLPQNSINSSVKLLPTDVEQKVSVASDPVETNKINIPKFRLQNCLSFHEKLKQRREKIITDQQGQESIQDNIEKTQEMGNN